AKAGATDQKRSASAQANRVGVDETHHHPGQGLEVAKVQPVRVLAKHATQRIIEIRRVLHGYPPQRNIVESCSGSILTRRRGVDEHVSLLSVNQGDGLRLMSHWASSS